MLKHAPGTSANVAIRNLGPHLEVVVANTGIHRAAADSIEGGHGLKGMQQRIEKAHLSIGETTVKTHVARMLMKLELRDRVQAVVFAYEAGVAREGRRGLDEGFGLT